jgi:hypothetical protein
MRKLLVAAVMSALLVGGLGVAGALTQWWTPREKDCPTFDTQASCRAYCTQSPARCGGNTTCISSSGAERPPC